MKITILLLFIYCSVFGQNDEQKVPSFNGIYETKCNLVNDEAEEKSFIRFYPNKKVLSVGTECDATVFDLETWFNLENKGISVGSYELKNNRIFFSTTSSSGVVKYKAKILKDGILKVKIKSLINGYKGRAEYKFTELTNIK